MGGRLIGWLPLLSFSLVITILCTQFMYAQEKIAYVPTTDPQSEVEQAVRFLESLSNEDRVFTRLGSTYSLPESQRRDFEQEMWVWWRQLTLNPNRRNLPVRVPGSGTLFFFDLRSFNWNVASWRAVALRDKAFREPWIPHPLAERMRYLIAENQPTNFHVIGLVDLWGLYRRTYQTTESSDYYDLLFSEQRFVKIKGDGDPRHALKLVDGLWKKVEYDFLRRNFVDFPSNDKEWLTVLLGGIKEEDYQKAIRDLRARRGAVCKGSEDVKIGGSFVARNNRIAWVAPVLARIGAVYGETFDVIKTAGKRDLEENAFTDQERDKGRVFRDGGELLFSLPAGDGVATLLINADGKRVEFVPNDIATHTRDARDRRVRNGAMSCLGCHADAYGWIPLNNVLEKKLPDEIDLNFRKGKRPDRQAAEEFDSFFLDWQDDLLGTRNATQSYWKQLTGTKAKAYKDALTGIQIGQRSLDRKWQYDDPLSFEQQMRETGYPEAILRVAASRSIKAKSLDVARKQDVSRATWDEDIFADVMTIASSSREILEGKAIPLKPKE